MRDRHLNNTLVTFKHYYKDRADYEVIIVEDAKNTADIGEHNKLLNVINKFKDDVNLKHVQTDFVDCYLI